MSNKIKFEVNIEFSDDILQDNQGEIRQNVLDALVSHSQHSELGLVGNNEGYTTAISVEATNTIINSKSVWRLP